MEIKIRTTHFFDVEQIDNELLLTAIGNNGNVIVIEGIKKRQLNNLIKILKEVEL